MDVQHETQEIKYDAQEKQKDIWVLNFKCLKSYIKWSGIQYLKALVRNYPLDTSLDRWKH